MNLTHCVCASFIFSCYIKSLRAVKKVCYSRFVTRACFFVHVHKKFAYWPWSWHLFRSPWPSFRMLAFLCATLVFQELMKKRSLKKVFCLPFCAWAQKICIFIWNILPVHAMLRTCKKWHHVHAMICTRFCIKKKWSSHSSQFVIVSEQGKTTARREENERGTILDLKNNMSFDIILIVYFIFM